MSEPSTSSRSMQLIARLLSDKDARRRIPRAVWRAAKGPEPIFLDYPIQPRPRYGYGLSPHPELYALIDGNRSNYLEVLSGFEKYAEKLSNIREDGDVNGTDPYWRNNYIGGLDAIALYCFAALTNPSTYLEVGSGNSTKFMRRSIRDNGLRTRIVSIDPTPRAEIDSICDEVIRQPLESVDLGMFGQLVSGDILLFDGSHMVFQNSDVTVFFLEVLPRLAPGVLVYVDDIFLPYDYPPDWRDRFYSEQYILAALLIGDHARRYDIILPHVFIDHDEQLFAASSMLWSKIGREAKRGHVPGPDARSGNGMWLKIRGPDASQT
jgi:hypothetical protein